MLTENVDDVFDPLVEPAYDEPFHPLVAELEAVATRHDFVAALGRSANIARRAGRCADRAALVADLEALAQQGTVPCLLAIESLANVRHSAADVSLIQLLSHSSQLVRRHASWRLASRCPGEAAYPRLLELLTVGGIDTLHAHRTLRSWSVNEAGIINPLVIAALDSSSDPAVRARLVDLLGTLAGLGTIGVLLRVASDSAEGISARTAAIGALAERSGAGVVSTLQRLATRDNEIGSHAALALSELTAIAAPSITRQRGAGLRIAQLVLASGLDGQLSRGGRGDIGGVASLLVSLGETLAKRADVDHVHSIGLGSVNDSLLQRSAAVESSLTYATIPIGDSMRSAITPDQLWEQLPTLERGIRRALRQAGPIDMLHLRMADAGTLAGAAVAHTLGIPVCFSPAPDPHNVIQARQAGGKLSNEAFVALATETHVWFRARLVERLAHSADRLALFPRARPLPFLVSVEANRRQRRQQAAVVAEGIDIQAICAAENESSNLHGTAARDSDVLTLLAQLIPAERRNLPLLLSIGRLHPIKGMDRVVAAWVGNANLRNRCNLLIVGGDLDHPSATEQSVIDTIDHIIPPDAPDRTGLIMLGGKGHADVARVLVAAARGRDGYWAAGGVYVDGAPKEEFGLAVIEALAAGLVVVAPAIGGPPTYVEHGDTGILADSDADLGTAIQAAFTLVSRSGRAHRARTMVEQRYSIDNMAAQLAALYHPTGTPL